MAIVYGGEIVETGPTDAIFTAPHHQYTLALMRSIPNLALPSHSELAVIEGQPPSLIDPPAGCRFAARCPAVQARCTEQAPPLSRGTDGREWRCWFPANSEDSVPAAVRHPTELTVATGGSDGG